MDFYNEDGDSNIDYGDRSGFYEGNSNQVREQEQEAETDCWQPELEFQSFGADETAGVPPPELGDIELEDFSDNQDGTSERVRVRRISLFWQFLADSIP